MTGSAWTPMSVFNARIVNNGSCCISPRISDQSSANDNTQRLATTETTEQHGNFNLFHFQNDQMWPVNMTGKTKGWPVNSQISPDIVRWPAVISSPAGVEHWLLRSLPMIDGPSASIHVSGVANWLKATSKNFLTVYGRGAN